jgi:glycosyltransferase involved in cell wall biosynthesis
MLKVHLWAPGIRPIEGGIQGYSLQVYESLRDTHRLTLILKNDDSVAAGIERAHCAGSLPPPLRTAGFSVMAVAQALKERPDALILTHLHFAPLALAVKKLTGCRVYVCVHGVEGWGIKSAVKKAGLRGADRVLPHSDWTRECMLHEVGVDPGRIFMMVCTADEERFTPGPRPAEIAGALGVPPGAKVLLSVGRLVFTDRYKGFDRIIEIFHRVVAEIPNAHYVLVGDGDDRARLEELASRSTARDRIIFAGRAPAGQLADYYRLGDVFAMPSTGEGFGIVYVEALLTGKPVIAAPSGGARDTVKKGSLGLIADPDNPDELTETIIRLLAPRDVDPKMIDPAWLRGQAIEHYGMANFSRKLEALLQTGGRPETTAVVPEA